MADKEGIADLGKMKVADLKKALKERGLTVTGSKSELVDRLSESLKSDEATADTSAALEDALLDNVDLSLTEPAPAVAAKPKPKPQTKTETVEKTVQKPAPAQSPSTEEKAKVVSTTMSEAERLKRRAERFGVVNEDMKKQLRAERFGTSGGSSKLSTGGSGTDVDMLKKRAERFGAVTSTTLSKVEEEERIRKRKDRFGDVTAATNNKPKMVKLNASSEDDEKKKKRAERFGLS